MEAAAPTAGKPRGLAVVLEFLRFVATGAVAGVTNLVAGKLLRFVLPFELALIIAYIIGMVVAFWLFQRVIFRDPGTPMKRRVIRFVQVNMLGLALTAIISSTLARVLLPAIGWTFYPKDVAQLTGVGVPAFTSYFLHKYYTFR